MADHIPYTYLDWNQTEWTSGTAMERFRPGHDPHDDPPVTRSLAKRHLCYGRAKDIEWRKVIGLGPFYLSNIETTSSGPRTGRRAIGYPPSQTNFVFGHPNGRPRTPSTVTQQFRRIASRAGLSGVRLHDLRHTHASLMLQQGTDIKTISTRLGHSSVAFTMDTYAHLLPGMQKAAMEKFEEAFAVTGQNS